MASKAANSRRLVPRKIVICAYEDANWMDISGPLQAFRPQQLVGQPFIAMVNKAKVLRGVIDDYLKRSGVEITQTQGADPAMVISLVASMRGMSLVPAYVESLMPWSIVSRPLAGEVPTIDLAVGYKKTNNSPVLKLFLARLDQLIARVSTQAHLIARKSHELR